MHLYDDAFISQIIPKYGKTNPLISVMWIFPLNFIYLFIFSHTCIYRCVWGQGRDQQSAKQTTEHTPTWKDFRQNYDIVIRDFYFPSKRGNLHHLWFVWSDILSMLQSSQVKRHTVARFSSIPQWKLNTITMFFCSSDLPDQLCIWSFLLRLNQNCQAYGSFSLAKALSRPFRRTIFHLY